MFLKTFLWTLNIFLLLQLTSTISLDKTKSGANGISDAAADTTTTLSGVPLVDLTRRQQFLYHVKEDLYNFLRENGKNFKFWCETFLDNPFFDFPDVMENVKIYIPLIKDIIQDFEDQEYQMRNVSIHNSCFKYDEKNIKVERFKSIINIYTDIQAGNTTVEKLTFARYLNMYNFPQMLLHFANRFEHFYKNLSDDLTKYIQTSTKQEKQENADLIEWHEGYESAKRADSEVKAAVLDRLLTIINYV